jgi:YHS domain-containing protein
MFNDNVALGLSMNKVLVGWFTITVAMIIGGCATRSVESAGGTGPVATCYVCKHNNDLACVRVHVKEGTPSCVCNGHTYYFCSEECCSTFQKSPAKYLRADK